MDERNTIAERLRVAHLMGGEHRRTAGLPPLDQQILDETHVHGIESGRRLVHDAHLGLAHQRRGDLHFLAHAFAETVDPPRHHLGQIDPCEPLDRAAARIRPGQSLQRAEIGHHVDDGELRVQASLFREISEAIEVVAGPRMPERQATRPSSGLMMSIRIRMSVLLPAPFGPSRPKISPCSTLEGDTLERWRLAVALGQALEGNDGHARDGHSS